MELICCTCNPPMDLYNIICIKSYDEESLTLIIFYIHVEKYMNMIDWKAERSSTCFSVMFGATWLLECPLWQCSAMCLIHSFKTWAVPHNLNPYWSVAGWLLNHFTGVLLHHRGAYLKSVHLIVKWPLHRHCVYLWTVPIFHLNGWFFPYAVAAVAGVNVCLRKVVANDIFAAVQEHKVTHICGAPIVMSTMPLAF